jgi:hypothetical protein
LTFGKFFAVLNQRGVLDRIIASLNSHLQIFDKFWGCLVLRSKGLRITGLSFSSRFNRCSLNLEHIL